ncbi:Deoxyguanosinetriphosphate triphosphohydrolase [Pseudodesulfovibrio hydrargyri]|uniref:Deoxyguanosinetriphosphate triphosphohydrolase n=1 Tax=Pseudodesulfovibrio hydrargyri TaxID=2125990 RepID=A0A1J5MSI5_9BACT|nr:dNTP triphosphohydrolase [Pseudodesulfovibrio hydrargyri]OIQ49582.1 Deoxyguanosinetriphosphate triphosphohydrolase [Pseudodesulfovibrio hydrargyri]
MGSAPRMDWNKLLDATRYGRGSESSDVRSPFQRDIDRVLFSDHFRRLARKTQVHPLNENDHIHSRLTHSLEVASVGKSLGELVGVFLEDRRELPSTLSPKDVGEAVQAACLAHDIGNPPFGHGGEEAIKKWFARSSVPIFLPPQYANDFTRFDGNAMSVRILVSTGFNNTGMSPTYAVLGALLKYPWTSSQAEKDKFSFFQTEADAMRTVAEALGLIRIGGLWSRPPLAYLTEAADDICYRIIDIEDATELGILEESFMADKFAKVLNLESGPGERYAWIHDCHFRQRNSLIRAKLINGAVQEAATLFQEHYDSIMSGEFDRNSSLMEKSQDGICRVVHDVYKGISDKLFLSRRKTILEIGAQNALGLLLEQTMVDMERFAKGESPINERVLALLNRENIEIIPGEDIRSLYLIIMAIVDYISGMTDHYATDLCRKFLGLGY